MKTSFVEMISSAEEEGLVVRMESDKLPEKLACSDFLGGQLAWVLR